MLEADRLEAFVEKGTLVTDKADLDRRAGFRTQMESASRRRGQATTVGGRTGAATAPSAEHEDLDPDAPEGTEDAEDAPLVPEPTHESEDQGGGAETSTGQDGPKTEDGENVEMVDQFSSMDYKSMQDLAKDKGLQYVGISADDLRASLRKDAAESDS